MSTAIPEGWTPTVLERKTAKPGPHGWTVIVLRKTETGCWTVNWGYLPDGEYVYPGLKSALYVADDLAELAGGWKE